MGESLRIFDHSLGSDRTDSHGVRFERKQSVPVTWLVAAGVLLAAGFAILMSRGLRPANALLSDEGARRFASFWLSCLQADDLLTGLVLMLPPADRPMETTDLRDFFSADKGRRLELEKFYEDRLVQMLRGKTESTFTFTRTEQFDRDRGAARLWYRIEYTDSKNKRVRVRAELHLQYAVGSSGQRKGWWVRRVVFPLAHDYV